MSKLITVSDIAIRKLEDVLLHHNKSHILLYVKGGGCNGFNYQLKPSNNIPSKLDEIVKIKGVEIHICGMSVMHLLGTKIDWTEDIMGQGFKFENPMAQSKCGCGTSFTSKAA
jgi:iron-sulfur cluster assembly accessory protein